MRRDSLSAVGKTIKRIRKEKKMSLKDVAEKSDVTAGLLSKIENFRAIPSLPVLQSIAIALDSNLVDLVREVQTTEGKPYILVRRGEGEMEEREDSQGVSYEVLVTDTLSGSYLRTVIVSVNPGVYREQVVTDCWEIDYMLTGEITYQIADETLVLREGDMIYYDGNFPHSMENKSGQTAKMITFYFMRPNT